MKLYFTPHQRRPHVQIWWTLHKKAIHWWINECHSFTLHLHICTVLYCTTGYTQAFWTLRFNDELFKGLENRVKQQGGVCAVGHATLAQRPSRYVLYSIFMQTGVLWEEPELAVDSKRSRGSGNQDPVDTISHITLIFFGLRQLATSSFFFINKPKQQDLIKHVCLCLTLILQRNNSGDTFLNTWEEQVALSSARPEQSERWRHTCLNQTGTKSRLKHQSWLWSSVLQLLKQ